MENVVALVITLLVLGLVGYPLLRERPQQEEVVYEDETADDEMARLLAQKDTALTAIQELEFDHEVGSLSDEDYRELKERYEKKAISVLKSLDEIAEVRPDGRPVRGTGRTVKAAKPGRGERGMVWGITCPECGGPIGKPDRFCAGCGASLGAHEAYDGPACPECGEPLQEGDAFCAGCGAPLQVADQLEYPPYVEEEEVAEEPAEPGTEVRRATTEASGSYRRRRRLHPADGRRKTGGNGAGA